MFRLILFAKRPRPGRVKTRLVPPLTPAEALGLYRAMLRDSIHGLLAWPLGGWIPEVCFDGVPGLADRRLGPPGLRRTLQGPGDLGQRLLRAFRRSRAEGSQATVVVGADAPTLPRERIRQAFRELASGTPLVLAPAADGGYVLIGMREPLPFLFRDVPWGGPSVLAVTVERARRRGLGHRLLEGWYDVDDLPSLRRLRQELWTSRRAAALAPATARHLQQARSTTRATVI